ncbi:hypothetical protein [Mesorhizobium australafricanum]|uniref:Uncharacterized protein n=1 Tax=Mesorhizobium australafricanum TaxID=3072311 RepID=A0ABU4X5H6_9HYPH|nr:hypothetical protein [Mesorhizobium sp. VK3E]MDX8443577.1 hypothetical protein [Mesorhizobium sp. VK3E]
MALVLKPEMEVLRPTVVVMTYRLSRMLRPALLVDIDLPDNNRFDAMAARGDLQARGRQILRQSSFTDVFGDREYRFVGLMRAGRRQVTRLV